MVASPEPGRAALNEDKRTGFPERLASAQQKEEQLVVQQWNGASEEKGLHVHGGVQAKVR